MFPAAWLRKLLIRGKYDCEIAFLEAIPTRILGGVPLQKGCKRYTWVHNTLDDYDYRIFTKKVFRSMREIEKIYSHFDKIAFVSRKSISSFEDMIKTDTPKSVVHNVCEFGDMLKKSEETSNLALNRNVLNLCSVGRLCGQKGYDRLIRVLGNIHKKGYYSWHIYIIGEGPERNVLESMVKELGIGDFITFLGFQENPYKYLKQMDFLYALR